MGQGLAIRRQVSSSIAGWSLACLQSRGRDRGAVRAVLPGCLWSSTRRRSDLYGLLTLSVDTPQSASIAGLSSQNRFQAHETDRIDARSFFHLYHHTASLAHGQEQRLTVDPSYTGFRIFLLRHGGEMNSLRLSTRRSLLTSRRTNSTVVSFIVASCRSGQRTFLSPQGITDGMEVDCLPIPERVRHVRFGFPTGDTQFIGQGRSYPDARRSRIRVCRKGSRCYERANCSPGWPVHPSTSDPSPCLS